MVTPPPRTVSDSAVKATPSPPDRPKGNIVTPYAKLQLAAFKRAEATKKGRSEPWLNMLIHDGRRISTT